MKTRSSYHAVQTVMSIQQIDLAILVPEEGR